MALPVTVTILIPALTVTLWPQGIGWTLPPWAGAARVGLGLALLVSGFYFLTRTIRLFARFGRGTLAPWAPPRKLVVRDIYRYTRNPMITGVLGVLLGEALLFDSTGLLYVFAGFVLVNLVYIPLLEEPGLGRRFGADYECYRRNVPRWIPRLRPWTPPGTGILPASSPHTDGGWRGESDEPT